MKATKPIWIVLYLLVGAVAGTLSGVYRVSRGNTLPVSGVGFSFSMLGAGVILALLGVPVFLYRRAMLAAAKAATEQKSVAPVKRLDPFYAVRVLALAKAVAVCAAIIGGWHFALVAMQLTTPVVSLHVWNNALAMGASLTSMVVALAVEQLCKIPGGGEGTGSEGESALAANGTEATPA